MNKRIKAFLLCVSVVLNVLPFTFLFRFEAAAYENLGSVTSCVISGDKIIVSGSIKHSVLVANRESNIAIFKFDPWENVEQVISNNAPLKMTDMSISFDFELPCLTIADKTSLYAVAIIDPDGNATCISAPKYPDAYTSDTSGIGFKSINTNNTAAALASHAGSAVVDVYLNKLDNGNKSGHIFNADGDIFYFDREFISQLDKQILSYTAMGAEVLLRFLISPIPTNLPFCPDSRVWSANKCVVVDNTSALNAIYGYTYFLLSRYDGGEFGRVDGIILGRGADMPVLYNYASLISEDYDVVYARSLALIGLAAVDAAGDNNISLIVPISDSLTEKGELYAERFLSAVANYISSHSKLTFTVMCESRHNPYHINDAMFFDEILSDETGEDGEEITVSEPELSPIETEELIQDSETFEGTDFISFDETVTQDFEESTNDMLTDYVDTTESITSVPESVFDNPPAPEKPVPTVNTKDDGYYCTDSLDLFTDAFNKLKKKHNSINSNFAWCWYPDSETLDSALGVCYSYNYMKLAVQEVDFFVVTFEGDAYNKFPSLAHLFKYIDTSKNNSETEYARNVFEIDSWSDIIDGYVSSTGVYSFFYESELQPNISDFTGTLTYFNYSSTNNISGWYDGIYCNSIAHQTEEGVGYLQANFNLNDAGFDQAEIGYIFKTPEPLLFGDALTFDIQCGESDGSLYEIAIYINSENSTIVSKAVVAGGVRSLLSVDARDAYNTSAVRSIRIALTRITGDGDCALKLYKVSVNSLSMDDDALDKSFDSIRDYLRADKETEDDNKTGRVIIIAVLLSATALFSLLFAFANDRRLFKNTEIDTGIKEDQKRN